MLERLLVFGEVDLFFMVGFKCYFFCELVFNFSSGLIVFLEYGMWFCYGIVVI